MTKKYLLSLFFILFLSSCLFAESSAKYEMIDIGVLIADESEAIGLNDKGQVLGKLRHDGRWDVFLWDKDSGLQILDLPGCYDLHLNNKGQIAGNYSHGIFIWDKDSGFYNVGVFDGEAAIRGFNDNSQILITSWSENDLNKPHIYIWNHGITKEISNDFLKQFPEYSGVWATGLNNNGEVVLTCTCSQNNSVQKSFIWSEDKFTELFKEYGKDTCVRVKEFDDNGNIIVEVSNISNNHELIIDNKYELFDLEDRFFYFVNPSKVFQAEIVDYNKHVIIRNSRPQVVFCLPSELKKRFDGVYYYTPGAEIRKLMNPQYPYWFQTVKDIRINAQNSKGYVIGDSETVYLRKRHAFLAVPSGSKLQ